MLELDKAVDAAKEMKESNWEDICPFLHVIQTDKHGLIALPDLGTGPQAWMALARVLFELRAMNGPILDVLMVSDARMRQLEKGEQRPDNDNLQKKWEDGDRDGIVECLILLLVHQDGSVEAAHLPYDAESRTWLEQEDAPDDLQGGMLDALRLGAFSLNGDGQKMPMVDNLIETLRANSHLQTGIVEVPLDATTEEQDDATDNVVRLADYIDRGEHHAD